MKLRRVYCIVFLEYFRFQMLSDYAHGTSFYLKMHSSVFAGDTMTMLVICISINLYCMVTTYCWGSVNEEFYDVTDELEKIF